MKTLFIDIETSPAIVYTWSLHKANIGVEQIIKPSEIICFAAKWSDSPKMMFYSKWKDEEGMYEGLKRLLDESAVVVHYNGKRFDIPKINAQLVKRGEHPPTSFHQIDLYQVIRSRFRFDSNKLDHVTSELGLGKKVENGGFGLWKGWMEGDEKAIKLMEEYNKEDVRLTERLYHRVLGWIKNHPNRGLWVNPDRPSCTNCGSSHVTKRGTERTATMTYQRYKCEECGTNMRGRVSIRGKDRENILTQSKL